MSGFPSPDGKTLRFRLPDNEDVLLGSCAFSQLGPNEECPGSGYLLPPGDIQISVLNGRGESNRMAFEVFGAVDPPANVTP